MDIMEIMEPDSAVRPHPCSWSTCDKAFNRRSDLDRHYRIHTNERPYQCQFQGCGKSFIQQSALTVHKRTHTGEKPHTCTEKGCGRKFSDSSSLARHRRIHSGKRPYKCGKPGCEKSFCRKTTMIKHQRRPHPTNTTGAENHDGDLKVEAVTSPSTPSQGPYHCKWVTHVFSANSGRQSHQDHPPTDPPHASVQQSDYLVVPREYYPSNSGPGGDAVQQELPSTGRQLNSITPLPSSSLMQRSTVASSYASSKSDSDSEGSPGYRIKQERYDAHSSFESIPEEPHQNALAQDQMSVQEEPVPIQGSHDMYLPIPSSEQLPWYDYSAQLMTSTLQQHPMQGYPHGLYLPFLEPKLEFDADPSMQLPSARLQNE